MVKATAPLSPRQVLGNRQRALSIEEASALVAMLAATAKRRLVSLQKSEGINV